MSSLKQDCSLKSVAVIGGGVSGLAAAYKLKSHGLKVTLFEAEERAGGKLRSVSQEGLIWDEGANTMTESEPEVRSLLDNLGLREKQQFPISQNKRYIVRNAKAELIPTDPIQFIQSSFLSTMSKFHIILEPFLWRSSAKKSNSSDVSSEYKPDSVGDFFQRHFGKEVVDYLIDPFVAGSSAGDPDSLCMPYAFPEIWNLEKIHCWGDSVQIVWKKGETGGKENCFWKKKTSPWIIFISGRDADALCISRDMESRKDTLTDTLSKELGDDLELNSKVLSLSYNHDASPLPENWSLSYTKNQKQLSADLPFDAVIMTAPLSSAKEMKITREGIPFMLDFLPDVNYLPLSVIITTFKKEKVKRPLEGFGVLVPSKEQQNGLNTLGTLFSSMMFPDRAPSDVYLYTTFVGGSRNRELAKASLDELKQVVASDLSKLLGAEEQPTFIKRFYWSKAFPLYGHDYKSVLDGIEKMEESLPGFFYAGNHRGGLSVGKAIASGCKAADLVIAYLSSSNGNMLLEEAS